MIRLTTINQTQHFRPPPRLFSSASCLNGEWLVYLWGLLLIRSTSTIMLSLWVEGVHWSQLELASPPSAVAGSKNAAYLFLRILSLCCSDGQRLKTSNKKKLKQYFSINRWQKFCVHDCMYIRKENQEQFSLKSIFPHTNVQVQHIQGNDQRH